MAAEAERADSLSCDSIARHWLFGKSMTRIMNPHALCKKYKGEVALRLRRFLQSTLKQRNTELTSLAPPT